MLRSNSRRRSSRGSSHLCVAASASSLLLLLLALLLLLHSRLSSSPLRPPDPSDPSLLLLLDDADNDAFDSGPDDLIDVLDSVDDSSSRDDVANFDDDEDAADTGGYFWDHLLGVKRRAFGKRPGQTHDDEQTENGIKTIARFASDDLPVDGDTRAKIASIRGVEDALLLKIGGNSPLREGWARWFEAKGRFLRQDRMFGSSMEVLNPMNHPLLQDPDIPGSAILTRGDRMVRKAIWKELDGIEFPAGGASRGAERKALNLAEEATGNKRASGVKGGEVYADGKRWGYYPGLDPYLPFSEFVKRFLEDPRCELRVFMVWNSPPWTYGVRHQRGMESLLHHHKDACVLVFSETLELDFFRDFVKDGFRVAVAMPNLDELLKDTPLLIFTSVWGEWRRTRYYSIHYSELIRLAALFKYGGVYLDSDVIILKSLKSLENAFGMEENHPGNSVFNGAVMAFRKHSPFIKQCMVELYSTYDDSRLRWNGAELLHRVINKLRSDNIDMKMLQIKEPFVFFPIDSPNITRYFTAPADEAEGRQQEALLKRILDHSITFHLWNGVTSALVPEPGSIVERLINHYCFYCLDVL